MIEVEISSGDETVRVLRDPESADVAALIRKRAQDPETMITISDTTDEDRQLLIALSRGRAFVGLVLGEQQFQLATHVPDEGSVEMLVGGQTTLIDTRFAVDPADAARAAISFMESDPLGDNTTAWIAMGGPSPT